MNNGIERIKSLEGKGDIRELIDLVRRNGLTLRNTVRGTAFSVEIIQEPDKVIVPETAGEETFVTKAAIESLKAKGFN